MKRGMLVLVLVGLLGSPAMAELSLANLNHTGMGTVGILTPGHAGIYLSYKAYYDASDTFVLTFGFHWPYATPVDVAYIHHNFVYDNSEVEVIGARGVTPFQTGLVGVTTPFGGTTWVPWTEVVEWPNPTSGMWGVASLYEDVPGYSVGNRLRVTGSGIYPFFQVTLHVKDVVFDSYIDAIITTLYAVFNFTNTTTNMWWTGGAIGVPAYGMGVIPEPASMSLLACGLLAIGGGFWRRRR